MRILVCADFHPDQSMLGVSRLYEVRAAADHLVEVAERERASLVVFAGDLADPDSGSIVLACVELLAEFVRKLTERGIRVILIPGNHDVVEDGTGRTTLSPLRPMCIASGGLAQLFERPALVPGSTPKEHTPWRILALPYCATGFHYDPVEKVRELLEPSLTDPLLVIGHLVVEGVERGEESGELARGRDVRFPREEIVKRARHGLVMVNGHHHIRQRHEVAGGGTVFIPGSLARLRFGPDAANKPGAWIIEVPW